MAWRAADISDELRGAPERRAKRSSCKEQTMMMSIGAGQVITIMTAGVAQKERFRK